MAIITQPTTDASSQKVPEISYGSAVQPSERRRLASQVVSRHAWRVNALVRRQARGRNTDEAKQVANLALLEALGHFDPTCGASFWTFAFPRVRAAVANWAASELGAKRTRRAKDDPRELRNVVRRRPESFDEGVHGVEAGASDPESLLIEAEESLRLEVFVAGLSNDDRRALVPSAGRPKKDVDGRKNSLRARAKAFVEGAK